MSIIGDILLMDLHLLRHEPLRGPSRRNVMPGYNQWLDQVQPTDDERAAETEAASIQCEMLEREM